MQSRQYLFRLAVLFRGSCRGAMSPEDLVKRVKAAIESGDQNRLCAPDVDGATFLHYAACHGLVDSVQQLIKAGGKKLLFAATNKYGLSALHCASHADRLEAARLLIEAALPRDLAPRVRCFFGGVRGGGG